MTSDLLNFNPLEPRFRNLFNEAPFSAALLSGDEFVVVMANEVSLNLWGKDSRIIGKPLLEAMPEMKDQYVFRILQEVYLSGNIYEGKEQVAYLEKKGILTKVYVNLVYKPIRDDNQKITGVLAVGYDVSDQVIATQKLKDSETRARVAIEAAGLGAFEVDYQSGNVITSPKFDEIFGFDAPVDHRYYVSRIYPDDLAIREEAHRGALQTGKLFYEVRLILPNETMRWVKIHGLVVYDDEHQPQRLVGTAMDVTEQVSSKLKLEESEQSVRNLFEQTPVGLAMFSGEAMVIEMVNQTLLGYWGRKREEVISRPAWDAMPELIVQGIKDIAENVYNTGVPYSSPETQLSLLRNGVNEMIVVRFGFQPMKDWAGRIVGLLAIANDVTDLVKARQKVEKDEMRWQFLANSMPQVVWVAQGDGTVIYYNDRVNAFAGVKRNDDGSWSWQGVVHQADIEATSKAWDNAVSDKVPYQIEHRIKMRDGSFRWHLSRAHYYDTDEGPRWYGTATDVHDQKELEMNLENIVRDRTGELRRSNDDLQQFAHVASHDLKEPVRKVQTFANRLQDEFKDVLNERGNTFVNKILRASDRMNSMINGVLNYATVNTSSTRFEPVDLKEIVSSVEVDLEILIQEKDATIIAHSLPVVNGIPELVYQLFYNLINNSLKFAKKSTPSRIEITSTETSHNSKTYHEITVTDNGIGFGAHHAEEIFTTFVRLNAKDQFEGSGLGLALCQKIVERHDGKISASGEEGKGAVFTILLPR